ncbi:polyketide biosynthesis enoyl-CoA hydratase [Paenibacillus sp. IHB B 3415]|uniref:enoyl-CoA hydratase/isomerase n=1 Tax=Paenibacillus sp. IHB B 3415 TaxID=867080 RepID=UPI000575325B|nr:enoyl-CoA hydratase/isomerase [Paenibacillus sp. IHB B 3415]KHL97101.1 polyketide biosynthesis enoyl-CoA hydratase [Paenibacillus sp. IHB B 3415]
MNYDTIKVRVEGQVCYLQLYRPEAGNTINDRLVEECSHALAQCEESASVIVLEGMDGIFCTGADFKGIHAKLTAGEPLENRPEPLYALWQKLATGPFITIAHVRGKANAGGVGFAAACDIVLADEKAEFSLSELLFGLFPACVLPFLIRRTGFQKAHYMTLTTKPIPVQEAHAWGIVDGYGPDSEMLLRRHLLRLKKLPKPAIAHYKTYMNELRGILTTSKPLALAANEKIFADPRNLEKIYRYVEKGQFPWEDE